MDFGLIEIVCIIALPLAVLYFWVQFAKQRSAAKRRRENYGRKIKDRFK